MDAPHPAGTSDLIEEADAKSKTRMRTDKTPRDKPKTSDLIRHTQHDVSSSLSIPSRILLNTTAPAAPNLLYNIGVIAMAPYLNGLYLDLINLLAPGTLDLPRLCSQDNFVLVSQHIIKARCQFICRSFNLDCRINVDIDSPAGMRVPSSFARLVQGLGKVSLLNGAVTAYPVALIHRALTADECERFPVLTTKPALEFVAELAHHDEEDVNVIPADTMRSYIRFIDNIARKNVSLVKSITDDINGTPWYTIGVMDPANGAPADAVMRAYTVSMDKEPPLLDTGMALVVQRGYNGVPPVDLCVPNHISPIYENLYSMITAYNAST